MKKIANPSSTLEEIEGTVQGHRDGHGFVLRDDGQADIALPPNEMRAVLHQDRVKVRVLRLDRKGRPEGRVLEIIERPTSSLIGKLLYEGGVWLVAPEDRRYGQDVLVHKAGTGGAEPGQVVVVELTEPPALYAQPMGRVREVLGQADDPGMEIEIAVRKFGVPHVFSQDCLDATRKLPATVRAQDSKGRVDLTDVPLVTIDGEDARDFDDAVYCEPMKIGRRKAWRLLVAIADVSHYVQSGGAIDVDAFDRATSVYFPRRVIPMLPEKLSNGLCSLNPGVDRLCMVCDMVVSTEGEVEAYQFYPALMHSHARLTYTEVAAILIDPKGREAKARSNCVPHLLDLQDVFRALLMARNTRGAVDFETVETQIVCNEWGRIERIEPRVRNDAHRLIEEAMLAANVCAADFVMQHQHPAVYRVHEGPTPEKVQLLRDYLRAMGIAATVSDQPHPGEFQAIARATQERPDAQQIHTMLLRSMKQAMYTPVNKGHFGLAYAAYTHFTSPIRRYPDLLVHRVIKALLQSGRYTLPTLPTPGPAQAQLKRRLERDRLARQERKGEGAGARGQTPPQAMTAEVQAWQAAGLHCSANERRADEASQDVQAWLKCKYMREHLGESFHGTVSSVTSFGLFVTLETLYVEGLVHITELGGEYFRYDEVRQELRGERTGMRYTLGTRIHVQVSRVDLDARKIDFRIVPADESTPLTRGSRSKAAVLNEKPQAGAAGHKKAAGKGAAGKKATGKKASKPESFDAPKRSLSEKARKPQSHGKSNAKRRR